MFSYGMVLWQLFSRCPIHPLQHATEVIFGTVFEGLRPPVSLQDENEKEKLPSTIKKLITTCWDQDPNERPPAQDVASILQEYIDI
mmetsp:Transcript_11770/g.13625  ORF Transcript_11770/g.13625 Transcript_11770/m.13625 type:complete len:86 (+) Transcript_11770:22-279(+)